MDEMRIQMFVTNLKKCYFCVAYYDFENTNHIEILLIGYNDNLVNHYISGLSKFWPKIFIPYSV